MIEAGVARVDITPPLGLPLRCWAARTARAQAAHEPLLAQALVVRDDHGSTAAIVAVDLPHLGRGLTNQVRKRVHELLDLPGESILINASHSHGGPPLDLGGGIVWTRQDPELEAYAAVLPELLAGAVYGAWHAMRPARSGSGSGRVSGVSVNRVRHENAVDDSVQVLRVDGSDVARSPWWLAARAMARAWLATFRIGTRISRLRCALPYPLFVTVSGAQVGGLMGGSVIIEVIFGLPGVGYSLVQAIYNRDYPIVQVAAVYLAAVFVLVNLGVDLLYGVIDPRIKQN